MRSVLCLLGICAGTALLSSSARSAEDDVFTRQQIDVTGIILGERHGDFNGDGSTDIILVVAEPSGSRHLYLYLQREMGRFPPTAGQKVTLGPTVNQVECVDLNGDRRHEVLVVDRDGLWQYTFDGAAFGATPVSLVSQPTIYVGGLEDCLVGSKILYSISGKQYAFLPAPG
jgi:hypothetical protein